jgi:DNA-binding transcriptional LysR family regulator
MSESLPHLSTDQVAAFVELSRHGQIRAAAAVLGITEQGLRNRLLALEAQLGIELYRKIRGPRRSTVVTDAGRRFLPHAVAFLDRARELCGAFDITTGPREIRIAASQYLIRYVLIDVLTRFATVQPDVHVRISTMTEQQVENALLTDSEVALGLAAPYEPSTDLEYLELFAMPWSLICPPRHPLHKRRRVTLEDVTDEPLILYERGSTGRQHVLGAFHDRGLSPRISLETTSTETIVSMVESGLGLSIVPLLPSGAVTRGRRVIVRPLESSIRPIHSGFLWRRREQLPRAASDLVQFTKARVASGPTGGRSPFRDFRLPRSQPYV